MFAGGGIRCTDLHHRAGRTGVAECLALCPSHQVRISVVGGVDDGAHHTVDQSTGLLQPTADRAEARIREQILRAMMNHRQSEHRIGQA
jgi:hypothetical protein